MDKIKRNVEMYSNEFDWRSESPSEIKSNNVEDYAAGTILEAKDKEGNPLDIIFRVSGKNSLEVIFEEYYSPNDWDCIIDCSWYCDLLWAIIRKNELESAYVIPVEKHNEWSLNHRLESISIVYYKEINCDTIEQAIELSLEVKDDLHVDVEVGREFTELSLKRLLK